MNRQEHDLVWFDIREFGVEGKGWDCTASFYDRLPARAEALVRPRIWELSRQPAGICAHFSSDALEIWARWSLGNAVLSFPHMPSTGVSGLDLYADDGERWRWAGVAIAESQEQEGPLLTTVEPGTRRYRVYLPLFNPVTKLEIGVPHGATLSPIRPRTGRPIVFYGTSIVHGGCASRPGTTHPAILGRRLDCPIINLGFSGNAIMEPEIADLLAELDPALYVIDAVPNMNADMIHERAPLFLRTLRLAHPSVPIVLVEARRFPDSWLCQTHRTLDVQCSVALRAVFDQLSADGIAGMTYVPGDHLFGDDNEGTVDSSHPTDLGFLRMADVLEPVLRAALRQ